MKKIVSLLLCVCFSLNMGFSVFAAEQCNICPYNRNVTLQKEESIDEQLSKYISRRDISEDQKQVAIEKANSIKNIIKNQGTYKSEQSSLLTTRDYGCFKCLSVPWYSQTEKYYCGPATTKQTVQYLTGNSESQLSIAEDLNTDLNQNTDTYEIRDYLNDNTNVPFTMIWKGWTSEWKDDYSLFMLVKNNVDNDTPIVAYIKVTDTSGNWLYRTNGHYLNYNGYDIRRSTIDVTDPFIDRYVDQTDGKYIVYKGEAYDVTYRLVL